MTDLADILPLGLLGEMLKEGYVRHQTHPTLPLSILNYTEKAAYEGVWNDVTRVCRGLIYETTGPAGVVVARPFPKFFNHGEPNAPELDLDAPAIVTDELGRRADGYFDDEYPPSVLGFLQALMRETWKDDHGSYSRWDRLAQAGGVLAIGRVILGR